MGANGPFGPVLTMDLFREGTAVPPRHGRHERIGVEVSLVLRVSTYYYHTVSQVQSEG
jgi:hypothetical protein